MKTTLATGCGLQLAILALGWVISFPATRYVMDYWGSQINQCSFATPLVPGAIVNTVTFGTGLPVLVAGGTFAWETITQDDVMPGPRAQRKGLSVCD